MSLKVLIVGGQSQGKLEYAVARYGLDANEISDGSGDSVNWDAPAVNRLHLQVRNLIAQGKDPQATILQALSNRESWVLLCDELGCGVVPVDADDRRWREETGRLCIALAQQAHRVERIACGIPVVLKGDGLC